MKEILDHLHSRVKAEFEKHAKYMDAETFASCVTAKMKDCVEDHTRKDKPCFVCHGSGTLKSGGITAACSTCRPTTRSGRTLASFTLYCLQNPEQRFWQALRNWSGSVALWKQTEGLPTDLLDNPPVCAIEDTYENE